MPRMLLADHERMIGLPPSVADEDRLTGIACPDCCGVLSVRDAGNGHIRFTCRIGHAYTVKELLVAKEDAIEERLWKIIVALEELAQVLDDLDRRSGARRWQARVTWLRQASGIIREVNDDNEPIDLGPVEDRVTERDGR